MTCGYVIKFVSKNKIFTASGQKTESDIEITLKLCHFLDYNCRFEKKRKTLIEAILNG